MSKLKIVNLKKVNRDPEKYLYKMKIVKLVILWASEGWWFYEIPILTEAWLAMISKVKIAVTSL